jgi:hypothetical protein
MKKLFKTFLGFFRRKPKINIEPKLLEFLKEKGVLKEFMINYNGKSGVAWRKRLNASNISIIDWAFDWEDTPQGWEYWNDLDKEYQNK